MIDPYERSIEAWAAADRAVAARDPVGPFLGADVPDHHASEIRERLERARLAGVFLGAPVFMVVTRGPEHRIVNVNPTCYRLTGPRALLERPVAGAVPELGDSGYLSLLDQVFETGTVYETGLSRVALRRGADGQGGSCGVEDLWLSFACYPLGGGADGPRDVLVAGIDATEDVRSVRQQAAREEEMRTSRSRLRSLSRDLIQVREEERRRIARHLHDVVGQTLTAAKFRLDALQDDCVQADSGDRLSEALDLVGRSLRQIRDLSVELRPALLDDLGLLPAIRWYLDQLGERADFGIELRVGSGVASAELSSELQTQAFRITQEALLNATRHAGASRVEVDVAVVDEHLRISVRDDGRGFGREEIDESSPANLQLGLLGMEERASLVGGELTLESAPGEGTVVRLRAPREGTARPEDSDDAAEGRLSAFPFSRRRPLTGS